MLTRSQNTRKEQRRKQKMMTETETVFHHSYLLVAVLHSILYLSFGGSVFFKVDLL